MAFDFREKEIAKLQAAKANQLDNPYYDQLFESDQFGIDELNNLIRGSNPFITRGQSAMGGGTFDGYKTFAGASNAKAFENALKQRFAKAKDKKAYAQRLEALKGMGMDEVQAIQAVDDPRFQEFFQQKGLAPRVTTFVQPIATRSDGGDTINERQFADKAKRRNQLNIDLQRQKDDAELEFRARALQQENQLNQQPQQAATTSGTGNQFNFQPTAPTQVRGKKSAPVADDSADIIETANAARFAYNQPGIGAVPEDNGVPRNTAAAGVVQGLIRFDNQSKRYVPVQPNDPRGGDALAMAANKELVEGKAEPYTQEHAKQFLFNLKNAQAKNSVLDDVGNNLAHSLAPVAQERPQVLSEVKTITDELSRIAANGNSRIAKGEIASFDKKTGVFKPKDANNSAAAQTLTAQYADAMKRLQEANKKLSKHDEELKKAQDVADENGYMISEDGRVYDPRRNKQFHFQPINPQQDYGGAGVESSPQAEPSTQPYQPVDAVREFNRNFVFSQNAKRDAFDRAARGQSAGGAFGINPIVDEDAKLLRMKAKRMFPDLPDAALDQVVINLHNEEVEGIKRLMKQKNISRELAAQMWDAQHP